MLLHRHWREVRWVAAFGAVAIFALGCYLLDDVGRTRREHVPTDANGTLSALSAVRAIPFESAGRPFLLGVLPTVLIACAVLLGVGGLGYERRAGTAAFTLSLPFTRRRVMLDRFATGAAALTVVALGAAAGTSAWAAIRGVGGEFPVMKALGLGCYLAAGALPIYAFAFLAANVTAEAVRTIATTVAFLVGVAIGAGPPNLAHDRWSVGWFLGPIDFPRLMFGGAYLDGGIVPWVGMAIALILTAGILFVTVRWVERFDF
jgi:ABC-2 type transport system permease protein